MVKMVCSSGLYLILLKFYSVMESTQSLPPQENRRGKRACRKAKRTPLNPSAVLILKKVTLPNALVSMMLDSIERYAIFSAFSLSRDIIPLYQVVDPH
jgi:hypothetical protein